MSSRSRGLAGRQAVIAPWLMVIAIGIGAVAAANADAAQFKMVACASTSGSAPYTTTTNTTSPNNPGGIFEFQNWCGGAGGDPPGDSAFLRINGTRARATRPWGLRPDGVNVG